MLQQGHNVRDITLKIADRRNSDPSAVKAILNQQRRFFDEGLSLDVKFRIEQLKRLKAAILRHEEEAYAALYADLHKSRFEAFVSETGFVLSDLQHTLKHLPSWAKAERVATSVSVFPASGRVYREPYGVTLVIAPWNYPFQLAFSPLIGAIAAGNTALVKPSELTPRVSSVIAKIIAEAFDPTHVTCLEGGVETSQALLAEKWDYIFFTGGTAVGRVVMEAAARHLTPVTLELGGKSPCIVDETALIEVAAKRIAWGKFFNCGQTCVAPDYLLVQRRVRDRLVEAIRRQLEAFYGVDASSSPDYGRIVNDRHFQRLTSYLSEGRAEIGGQFNASDRYIAPTLLSDVSWEASVMQDEIFGPILPIFVYDHLSEAIERVKERSRPLALYFFSEDAQARDRIIKTVSFGGGCINDTISHLASPELPFGGVGDSGMGAYHGKASFDTFSHVKSVLSKSARIDPPLRYAPYAGKLRWVRRLLGV